MGHHLRHGDRATAAQSSTAGGVGPGGAFGPGVAGRRGVRLAVAASRCGLVTHGCVGSVQLRHLPPTPDCGRVPTAGRRGGCIRWAATFVRRRSLVGDRRSAATKARSVHRRCRGVRSWSGRDPSGRPLRCRRHPRRSRGDSLLRHRRGAHQTIPHTSEPDRCDWLAAAHGRGSAGPTCGHPRGRAAGADRAAPRGVRLPQPGRHRSRLRVVVRRHPTPSDRGATSAGSCRSRHRCRARLDRARPVIVAAAAGRLRDHVGSDRPRCLARAGRCPGGLQIFTSGRNPRTRWRRLRRSARRTVGSPEAA